MYRCSGSFGRLRRQNETKREKVGVEAGRFEENEKNERHEKRDK